MANQLPNIPDSVKTDHLPSLFNSYRSLNGFEPSSWIVWSDDDSKKPVSHIQLVCHAAMREDKGFDHLITAVPNSDAISIAYQRMLIHGPFRGLSDLISLEQFNDCYFIHCSNLSLWPANVLFNYCIATRMPIEHFHLLPLWAATVEEGYDPTLAFLLSYSTNGKEYDGHRQYPYPGHFWFGPSSDWTRILSGDMTEMHKSYKTNPGAVTPCDKIWGTSKDWEKLRNLGSVEISEFFGLPIQKVVVPPKPVMKKIKLNPQIGVAPGGIPILWHAVPDGQINPFNEVQIGPGIHDEIAVHVPANPWGAAPHLQPQPEILDDDDHHFDDDFEDHDDDL